MIDNQDEHIYIYIYPWIFEPMFNALSWISLTRTIGKANWASVLIRIRYSLDKNKLINRWKRNKIYQGSSSSVEPKNDALGLSITTL